MSGGIALSDNFEQFNLTGRDATRGETTSTNASIDKCAISFPAVADPQLLENIISIHFPINPGQVNSLDPKKFGFLLFVDVAGYYVTDFGISLGLTRFNFCRILLL